MNKIKQVLKILDENLPHPQSTSPHYFHKLWNIDRYVEDVIGMYVGGSNEDDSFHIRNAIDSEDWELEAAEIVSLILRETLASEQHTDQHRQILTSHQPFIELCKKLNIKL